MGIVDVYKRYKATYRNYVSVIWNLYKKKDAIDAIFKDGTRGRLSAETISILSKVVESGTDYSKAMEIVQTERIPFKNNIIIMHGLKNNGDIVGVFLREDYKFLNVKNKVVIDIGASIGDSAVYFSLNGATKVIGLEPYPNSFNFAVRNVKDNNLDEKIELLNASYGKDGEALVDENLKNNTGMDLKLSEEGKKIRVYSLKSLIDKFKINMAVLKMDCEGCEFNLLHEENSTLAKFSQMQIECHYECQPLIEKLRDAGLNVNCTKPKKVFNAYNTDPKMLVRWIYASRPE